LSAPFIAIWIYNHWAGFIDTLPLLGNKGFAAARLEIWDYVSRYALQNPWYGYGLEATRHIQFESKEIYQKTSIILHPHNFAFQTWIEFGLIGVFTAIGLFTGLILTMQKYLTPQQAYYVLPALVVTFSVASTGYGMWQAWWIGTLFTVAAICILAARMDNETVKATNA
jgi:O-antigen ligase